MLVSDFYGRKSTKDDGRSVESQEDEWREDCADQGFLPGKTFADPGRSASRHARRPRPNYEQLIEHIRAGDCQILSMWESSRGSRDLGDWVALLDLCRKQGTLIRIIEHRRTYDIRVRRDWRTLAEDGIDSADESEKTSERTKRGKRKAARQGRPTSRLAYGFRRIYDERGQFVEQVEHPDQAPIVREIIESFADGKTCGEITRALNERHIPVPQRPCPDDCAADHRHFRDMTWTGMQVRQIALRAAYAGKRVHGGEVVGDGVWEPLVDPEVWQKVYDLLTDPRRGHHRGTRLTHWLTGAVVCGLCSGLFASAHQRLRSGRPRPIYECRQCHRVSASAVQLEAFLEPLIDSRLHLPDTKNLFVPRTDDKAVQALDDEIADLERRLAEFRAEGKKPKGLSAAAVAEAEQGLIPLIDAAKAKRKELALPPTLKALAGVDVTKWKTWNVRARRDLVLAVAHIVIAPGSRGGQQTFNAWRLAGSRWTGDKRTWGEIWQAEGFGAP